MAIFAYDAANADEISFKEGQMIEFINDLEEGWATGKLIETGKVGHYPTNFVEVSFYVFSGSPGVMMQFSQFFILCRTVVTSIVVRF